MKKTLLALGLAAAMPTFAADYTDGDTHKNDYKWIQGNLMYSIDEAPRIKGADEDSHDYFELEFGGRAGILDYYGYVDFFNLTNSENSDKADGSSRMFAKLSPRFSLDGITGKDLSFGPVQEVYLATLFNIGGGSIATEADGDGDLYNAFVGVGSDVSVPWLGKVGLNAYALYDVNVKDWNGYQISANWFKPFYFFENGSFFAYQGYFDYQFALKDEYSTSSNGGAWFNGIYWHSDRFSLGYGLKAYKDVYGVRDGLVIPGVGELESTGVSHYFAAIYKF